jgi:hypothetical protein
MPDPIERGARARFIGDRELALYTQLCAFYTVTVNLNYLSGAVSKAARMTRPEPFVVRRIQWATTGDTLLGSAGGTVLHPPGSLQGRTVRLRFGDAFTQFLGQRAGLVSAVFGDSNGFMDLPKGIVFGGSQNLEVELTRLFRPSAISEPAEEIAGLLPPSNRWDFVFSGVSLLPHNVAASGSE